MAFDPTVASKQYLKSKIESSSPIGLVVILYDGGVKFLSKAIEEYENNRFMGFSDNVVKAQNIVRELRDSLDMSVEGISTQLRSLYSYMLKRLIDATVSKSIEPVQEVLRMIGSLRKTWEKVKKLVESGQIEQPKSRVQTIMQVAPHSNYPTPNISIKG